MTGLQLPPKPKVAMPRLQDARNSHTGTLPTWKEKQVAKEQDDQSTQVSSSQMRAGQKRKTIADEDNNTNQNLNKRAKLTAQSSDPTQLQEIPALGSSQFPSVATKPLDPILNTNVSNGFSHINFMPTAPATLRWDPATRTFVLKQPDATTSDVSNTTQPKTVDSHNAVATKQKLVSDTKRGPKTIPRNVTHEYNLREQTLNQNSSRGQKRPAPEDFANKESGNIEKRSTTTGDVQEQETITNTPMHEIVAKNKKKNKHRPYSRKKAKNPSSLNMLLEDLLPHYNPDIEAAARARAREAAKSNPSPKSLMDMPMEVRLNIWDKVFEDEAYKFSLKNYSTRDDPKHMIPKPPPSYNCLFIHPTLTAEVQEQMHKSMRLEINFGRLRPHAMRKFMTQIGDHKLGREAQRIFFIKKFGLNKVNMGHFANAKEIVSTHWTVEGNGKMDEDDYKNNRIDPQHILVAPRTETGRLKGLKERRFWKDQLAASEQYKRHMEGWCHPEAADPTQTIQVPDPLDGSVMITRAVEVERKPCPFANKCLNLEDTKFCIVVKYKFGCIKGRHSRHKEVFYDFFPEMEELVQLAPPKSKFHKKCGKGGEGN